MTSSPKPPTNNSKPSSGASSSTATSSPPAPTHNSSAADGSSPSGARRDARATWKDSLRSSQRSTKRRGGGRFLLSQYFHHESPESKDRGRSPAAEPDLGSEGKGKQRIINESSVSGSAKVPIQRTSSAETKSTDEMDDVSMEGEERRSTSMDHDRRKYDRNGHADQAASLDASRIVSMALNLSEGRRRNVSGNHMIAPQTSSGHRVASGGLPTLHGQYGSGAGGSLRKHLQDQRQIARAFQADPRKSVENRVSSGGYSLPISSNSEPIDSSSMSLSHGTISRVEKAKKYIELSAYYRDLLGNLPPLKPHARYAAPSRNGRANAHSKHANLGRAYNPLQLIRNRKTRVRERIEMNPDPPTWDNSQAVKAWLELVELFSEDDGYMEGDEVMLPDYPTNEFGSLQHDQQGNTSGTPRYKRPRVDWIVSPSELLADAYWLEHDQHKSYAEDRHGFKLFPKFSTSKPENIGATDERIQDSDSSSPRYSLASERARDSDGISEKQGRDHSGEYRDATDSSMKLKQVWHKTRGRSSSSFSGLSYSDDERGNKTRRKKIGTDSDFENTAPLEKNLNIPIDIQSTRKPGLSPSVISPGTPDKWGTGRKVRGKLSGDADVEPLDLESWKTPENLNKNREHLFTPDIDDSNPNSPITGEPIDKLPESTKKHSTQKSRRSLLPFGKGDGQKAEKNPIAWPLHNEKSGRHSDTTTPRHSLDIPGRIPRPPTRDSYADTDSPQILPYSPRTRSKDRSKNKSFAAGIIGSVNEFVRNEGHGRFRRKKDTQGSKDFAMESPRHSLDGSEAEQSSGSHGAHGRKSLDSRHKKNGIIGSRAQTEQPSHKVRPRLLERIDLPTFRPSGSPSGSRPGTPSVEKGERRLLPAFRPLSRSGSYRDTKPTEAPISDQQPQSLSPLQPQKSLPLPATIPETHRPWPVHHTHNQTMIQNSSDLARLRALLLCSGIKVSGIMENLLTPRPPVDYLNQALASTRSKNFSEVPLASQPQTAASYLTSSLNASSRTLHLSHAKLPVHLNPVFTRLTGLRATATALVDHARDVGDDASNTTAMITGQKTIEVRQVIDAVDSFRRKRRRRLRWIRRVAFAGLEWGVLLIMWMVWAIVVIINVVWKGTKGVVRVARWALWL